MGIEGQDISALGLGEDSARIVLARQYSSSRFSLADFSISPQDELGDKLAKWIAKIRVVASRGTSMDYWVQRPDTAVQLPADAAMLGTKTDLRPETRDQRQTSNPTNAEPRTPNPEVVGGINLDPAQMQLLIERDANDVPVQMDPAVIQNIRIDGLTPVIINIAPLQNLPLFLGVSSEKPLAPLAALPQGG